MCWCEVSCSNEVVIYTTHIETAKTWPNDLIALEFLVIGRSGTIGPYATGF